jgi:hypothetical protein
MKAGLKLIYNGKTMNVPPENIDEKFWQKGDREYSDQFGGGNYYLWGIHFKENAISSISTILNCFLILCADYQHLYQLYYLLG